MNKSETEKKRSRGKTAESPKVDEAERGVEKSADEFGTAMSHLGSTIESRAATMKRKAARVTQIVSAPKRAIKGARVRTRQYGRGVRKNPAPTAVGAGLILAGIVGVVYGVRWGLFRKYYWGVFPRGKALRRS